MEFTVGLGDDDRVSQPLGVDDFPDEDGLQHLPHLVADEVLPLRGLVSDLLLYGPRTGVHGKMMLDHLPGDPGHVGRFPRKHVNICPEKSDEHIFLFLPQLCPYGDGVLGIIPEVDPLGESRAIGKNALLR